MSFTQVNYSIIEMDLSFILQLLMYLTPAAFIAVITMCAVLTIFAESYPKVVEYVSESEFLDVATQQQRKFPSLNDPPSVQLSVIVPAFNEETRLPVMMNECLNYLESRQKTDKDFSYEVIVVNDGSRDRTTEVGLENTAKLGSDKVRVLTLAKNRGKGGAVRLGMLRARGKLLLFADADGATKFSDYEKLEESMKRISQAEKNLEEVLGVVCGSRAHLEKESVATRSYFRTILMYGFHTMVWTLTVRGIRDTQCGFKLLTRRTGRILFNSLHIDRWAFDVEMLYIAQCLGIPVREIAVNWTEIEGSKVTPVLSWIQMGLDLLLIWLRYRLGAWKIKGDPLTE